MTSFHGQLTETAQPETEPVSLDDAKAHLRIDHDADDDVIARLISVARMMAEEYTGRAFIRRTSAWSRGGISRFSLGERP